jgi:zinc transporter ZupT
MLSETVIHSLSHLWTKKPALEVENEESDIEMAATGNSPTDAPLIKLPACDVATGLGTNGHVGANGHCAEGAQHTGRQSMSAQCVVVFHECSEDESDADLCKHGSEPQCPAGSTIPAELDDATSKHRHVDATSSAEHCTKAHSATKPAKVAEKTLKDAGAHAQHKHAHGHSHGHSHGGHSHGGHSHGHSHGHGDDGGEDSMVTMGSADAIHAAIVNCVADGLHNMIDGALIGATFLVSPSTGWTTAIAVALHELPQELADFAVLTNAGLTTCQALMVNLLVSFTAFLGAIIAIAVGEHFATNITNVLPFAGGLFLYLALAILMPTMMRVKGWRKVCTVWFAFAVGVAAMGALTQLPWKS